MFFSELNLEIPEEKISSIANNASTKLNATLLELRRLFLVENMLDSIKYDNNLFTGSKNEFWFSFPKFLFNQKGHYLLFLLLKAIWLKKRNCKKKIHCRIRWTDFFNRLNLHKVEATKFEIIYHSVLILTFTQKRQNQFGDFFSNFVAFSEYIHLSNYLI